MENTEEKKETATTTDFNVGDTVKYYNRKGEDEHKGEITKIYESYTRKGIFLAVIKTDVGSKVERYITKIRKS